MKDDFDLGWDMSCLFGLHLNYGVAYAYAICLNCRSLEHIVQLLKLSVSNFKLKRNESLENKAFNFIATPFHFHKSLNLFRLAFSTLGNCRVEIAVSIAIINGLFYCL